MSIIIYSTTTCPWCVKAKEYFTERGLEFSYINVAEDKEAFNAMVQKSKQRGVPVIDIDGTIIIGFDKPAIDELIGSET